MQSKIVINIFAIVSCIGLSAFFVLNTIDFIDALESEKVAIERQELLRQEDIIIQKMKTSQSTLDEVIAKKNALEKSIAESEISRSELQDTLSALENKKVLAIDGVKALRTERLKLTSILEDLRKQIEDKKDIEILRFPMPNQKNDNDKKLYLKLTDLKEQNKILDKELIILRNNSAQSLSGLNLALGDLKIQLEKEKNKYFIYENKSKKEIEELTQQIKLLGIKKNKNLEQLRAANEVLLTQLNMEKDQRELLSKSDKEIDSLKHLKSNFEKLNGLRVIFSGNMIYDDQKKQIVFKADNSIGIPIFQDDFTGSIAGKCGLPIDKEIQNRCSATIIAEFVVEKSELFLRGKEIVEIVKK